MSAAVTLEQPQCLNPSPDEFERMLAQAVAGTLNYSSTVLWLSAGLDWMDDDDDDIDERVWHGWLWNEHHGWYLA